MTFKDTSDAYEYFIECEYGDVKREHVLTELLEGWTPVEAYELGRNMYDDAEQLEDDAREYAFNEWISDNNIRVISLEN